MVVRNRRGLESYKGLGERSFWDQYGRLKTQETFIHFRYATHGTIDLNNCHPFSILGRSYWLLHNGVIDIPIEDKTRSDTWHFAHRVVAPALKKDPARFNSHEFERDLSGLIGASKLVIVREDGESMIVNRELGAELDGLWLSNTYSITEDRYDDWDYNLDDLAALEREEIEETCREYPELVAHLILEYFS